MKCSSLNSYQRFDLGCSYSTTQGTAAAVFFCVVEISNARPPELTAVRARRQAYKTIFLFLHLLADDAPTHSVGI